MLAGSLACFRGVRVCSAWWVADDGLEGGSGWVWTGPGVGLVRLPDYHFAYLVRAPNSVALQPRLPCLWRSKLVHRYQGDAFFVREVCQHVGA